MLRQPIVCVLGHVDHGKTSLLDAVRKTSVQKKEAGAITQHIGASEVPLEAISGVCGSALSKMKIELKIPGLLFIDTPGHEAFTNLRERGGSIADIAILVVDIRQGIQPQTLESIKILKQFKTPFLIAATKVDTLEGWKSLDTKCVAESLKSQNERAVTHLDENLYKLIGRISEFGINSERFDRVEDFTKTVVIIPVSAKSGEGIQELLLFLSGLAQRFLEAELSGHEGEKAEGSILEVREERGLGTTIDVILYKGTLRKNDTIVYGTVNGGAVTKIRAIIKPKPASQITNQQEKYDYPDEVHAACGVKIFAPGLDGALPGSPIVVANTKEEQDEEAGKIKEQIGGIMFERDEAGVVVKADTLGSLEAVLKMLAAEEIPIRKAGVGNVNKKDALDAMVSGAKDPVLGAVLGFGVKDESGGTPDRQAGKDGGGEGSTVKVFLDKVVYSLIENYKKWVVECREKEKSDVMAESIYPAKIKSLPGCCFRKNGPAIFGIEVMGGKLLVKSQLMDTKGNVIGTVKGIQKQKESSESAGPKEQVAISVDGAFFGKDVFEGDVLYTYIRKGQAEELQKKEGLLSSGDKAVLEEILSITETRYI